MTSCSETLQEHTTEPEVFQNMDNFDLNDPKTFALSIKLQFPKFSKGFTASDFDPFVKSDVGEDNLVSLGRLAFPNEWQMQLKSKEVREKLIRMGRTKINTRTCWISPLSQLEVRGFIHWIPNAIPNKKLEEFLTGEGEVLFMENQKQSKWNSKVENDSRYFALYLRNGKTKDDVPHFITIGKFLGLVTIRGRDPACFHCKQVGHRKTECKKFREKLSDYSSRPPTGIKRLKPRGRRHVPSLSKAVNTDGTVNLNALPECVDCAKEVMDSSVKKKSGKKAKPKTLPMSDVPAVSPTATTSKAAQVKAANPIQAKPINPVQAKPINPVQAKPGQVKGKPIDSTKVAAKEKAPVTEEQGATAASSISDQLEDLTRLLSAVCANLKKPGLEQDVNTGNEVQQQVEEPAAEAAASEGKKKRKKKKKKASGGGN